MNVVLAQVEPGVLAEHSALMHVTLVSVVKILLYSKYVVVSNGKIELLSGTVGLLMANGKGLLPKPPVYIPQQLFGVPVVLVVNPQNKLLPPSTSWRNGHEPPPHAPLPLPVFELSQEKG